MNNFNYPDHQSIESHCLLTWDIPKYYQDKLDVYYLHHWTTEFYLKHPYLSNIRHRNGIDYTVGYYQCIPSTLERYKEILLSFRRITGRDAGYVLIRPKLGTEITL